MSPVSVYLLSLQAGHDSAQSLHLLLLKPATLFQGPSSLPVPPPSGLATDGVTILDQFTVPPLITDPLSYSPPHPPIPYRMYNGVVYFVSPTTTMLAPLGQGIWTVDICNSPPRTV